MNNTFFRMQLNCDKNKLVFYAANNSYLQAGVNCDLKEKYRNENFSYMECIEKNRLISWKRKCKSSSAIFFTAYMYGLIVRFYNMFNNR